MPIFLSFIWEKVPGWVKWTVSIIVFVMWVPLYVRDTAISFVQKQASAAISDHKKDQALIDQRQDDKIVAMADNVEFIKYYLVYKRPPPKK